LGFVYTCRSHKYALLFHTHEPFQILLPRQNGKPTFQPQPSPLCLVGEFLNQHDRLNQNFLFKTIQAFP
jgi:hypothetical protein